MWLSSWLRKRDLSPKRRPVSRFRPQLEELEIRAVPATFMVNTTADILGHDNGMLSLRQATIDAKAAWTTANTIIVPAGTYNLTRPATPASLGGSLDINNSNYGLTMSGAGAGTTIIDGLGLDRVFDVTRGTVSISGLTIQGGNAGATSNGGGIRNQGATLTVSNCIFTGNTTAGTGGGAISDLGGALTVSHCTFANSSSTRVSSYGYGGGAIWISSGTATISDSTFSGNSAWGKGGAIFNQGTMTVSNCTFSGNSTTGLSGGAIDNQGTMTVSNCMLSGNSAGLYGGGIVNYGTLTIRGSTLTGNTAPFGADIYGKVSLHDTTVGNTYYP